MSEFDGKWRCTVRGKVVYDRPHHSFTWADAYRIIRKIPVAEPFSESKEYFKMIMTTALCNRKVVEASIRSVFVEGVDALQILSDSVDDIKEKVDRERSRHIRTT